MQVFGTEEMEKSMHRAFGKSTPDAIYICLHQKVKDQFEYKEGLAIAEELITKNPDNKIIVYGFESIQGLWLDNKFKKVMSSPNIKYQKMPGLIEDIVENYNRPKFKNSALAAVSEIEYEKDLLSQFKHDLYSQKERVLKEARTAFEWDGNDEEIETMLKSYNPKTKIDPQYFEGVFCDIEGTLIINGKLNTDLAEELQEYSRKKTVNIWTGKNLNKVIPLLKSNNIEFPLLSKDWYKDCTVEYAIDDLEEKILKNDYGITAREYRKI
ncbi:MAG: hypothetical protein U9R34_03370 [Nanoarchaeota archaeon]|nr:hypothetical protein [Nanoarchaeota archaeon]